MSWDEIYTSEEMSEHYDDKRKSERLQSLSTLQGVSGSPGTSRAFRTNSILPQHLGIVRQGESHSGERKDGTGSDVKEDEE